MDNTRLKNGEWSRAVPVLGIDLLVTEIDIMLLLTGELLVGQTREGLHFFHEHHLRATRQQEQHVSHTLRGKLRNTKAVSALLKKMIYKIYTLRQVL